MTSYIILKHQDGWKIKEKRYMTTIAIVKGTYQDAINKLKAIKEKEKADAEAKRQQKAEIKRIAEQFEVDFIENRNFYKNGITPEGKYFTLTLNEGGTKRSLKCYTLTIENECIFTSGTIECAVEYILTN